jgi:hypothetical protein
VAVFRNRSESVSRLEGFSDTVFGFAITLLVVSLAVPNHFDELLQQLRGLPVFAVTFALVANIWYVQYLFFRRYATSDVATVVLTLVLLFVVLFYVYPLKFLFGVAFGVGGISIRPSEVPALFLIYGIGFASVSTVLALLYVNAYRRRKELGLSDWEIFVTRLTIVDHLASGTVGLVSAGLALVVPEPATSFIAGYSYILVALVKFVAGSIQGLRARAIGKTERRPPARRPAP